ncbi:MAG: sensor histidine kinase [Myxococcota bacterium]
MGSSNDVGEEPEMHDAPDGDALLGLLRDLSGLQAPEALRERVELALAAHGLRARFCAPADAPPDDPKAFAASLRDDGLLVVEAPAALAPDLVTRLQVLAGEIETRLEGVRLFRRVERAKREWEGTFDAIGDGIAVVREDGTLRRANRGLARMVGRDVRDLPGSRWDALWPERQAPWPPEDDSSCQFERFGDTYRCFEETAHPGIAGGERILVVKDVTERRLVAERMQKLHEETREANRALTESLERLRATQQQLVHAEKIAIIGRLAAGLAHEINNPLGFITSNLRYMEEHAQALLGLVDRLVALVPEDQADAVAGAQREADLDYVRQDLPGVVEDASEGAERIRRIVTAIGEFADSEPGGLPLDVASVVEDAAAEARLRHGEDADIHVEPSEVPPVQGSARRLLRAVGRLLDNAVEAGGPVTVRTSTDNGQVVVEVVDGGPGVPAEVADRAFDPFVTSHPVGTHLGLGLTIAQAIAGGLRGEVSLHDRAGGRGTVARLVLPTAEPSP